MQSGVANASTRAGKWLLDYFIKNKMHARPMVCLYDSIVTLCPIEERFEVARKHEEFMDKKNTWHNHGRVWSYLINNEINTAWSERPNKEMRKQLDDPNWNNSYPDKAV